MSSKVNKPRCSRFFVSSLMASVLFVSSCSDIPQKKISTAANENNVEIWPFLPSAIPKNDEVEMRVASILEHMSDEQKVGQIMQPEIKVATPEDVKKYHVGSILNGGGTFPHNEKYSTVDDWVNLAEEYYQASMDTSDGGLAIPVIWGTDAVHGHNNVIGATLFPHNIGLGATRNPELLKKIGEATAKEVATTGITWVFAPTVAVVRNDRWGRTYEGYSEDPAIVRSFAGKIVEGMQGEVGADDMFADGRVVSTAKHFVGDGGTSDGVDRGDTAITEQELFDIHAQGYVTAISSGAQSVMASFNSWNGKRLHGHKYLLTDVLKDRMGFDGFVVGDWNGHAFIDGCTSTDCPQAINAGLDLYMAPDADWKVLYKNTLAQVKDGRISRERLNDAVSRILRVKIRSGLFEHSPAVRAKSLPKETIGSKEHREIARQAVRESLVLLKNNNQLLPLKADQHILVAGDGAHNIGKQSGGWTLSWQGTGNTNEDFPGGTSIYQGIHAAVEAAGGSTELHEGGEYKKKPDVAVVVFGEEPYAEGQGDRESVEYQPGDHKDLALLRSLKEQGIPVVSIFLTGRAMWVNPELNASDAFVVAWLPGSEGAGVADVIMEAKPGSQSYDFKGRLSYSWPKRYDQVVLNNTDSNYDPLFAFGYGLTLADTKMISNDLYEVLPKVTADKLTTKYELFAGRAISPWSLFLRDGKQAPQVVLNNTQKNSALTIKSVDKDVQEDSRRITWNGSGAGSVLLKSPQVENLTSVTKDLPVLVFDMNLLARPSKEVFFGATCGDDCSGIVEFKDTLMRPALDQWETHSIDVQCFVNAGLDLSKIESLFSMETAGVLDVTLANIRLSDSHPSSLSAKRCEAN